jgi:hypothetical protein
MLMKRLSSVVMMGVAVNALEFRVTNHPLSEIINTSKEFYFTHRKFRLQAFLGPIVQYDYQDCNGENSHGV